MPELEDKQLIALDKCMKAMADFANYERWQMLDYLAARYGLTVHVQVSNEEITNA